jgi:hypothetical protein
MFALAPHMEGGDSVEDSSIIMDLGTEGFEGRGRGRGGGEREICGV